MYQEIRKITDRKPPQSNPIKMEEWTAFYENLYTPHEHFSSTAIRLSVSELNSVSDPTLSSDISVSEVEKVLKRAARNKSPGQDLLKIEELLPVLEDPEAVGTLHKLFQIFWKLERVPKELKTSILVPIFKKGDKFKPCNYRPIALLSNLLKLYQAILDDRVSTFLESNNLLADAQHGFRPDRSLLDAHFLLAEAIQTAKHRRGPRGGAKTPKPLYLAFLDIKKAFDKVPRELLWRKLHKIGVRGKLLRVIVDMFTDVEGYVKIGDLLSDPFPINSGVIQGSKLGPILFNVFINDLVDELKKSRGYKLFNGVELQALLYADDLALLAATPSDLQELLNICERWAARNFLEFAPEKSKTLVVHKTYLPKHKRSPPLFLNSTPLEQVDFFTYLGIEISGKGDVECSSAKPYGAFVSKILQKAKKRAGVVSLLGNSYDTLRPATAIRLYKSLVRPILEFGGQVVHYSEKQLCELEKAQLSIVKRLLGLHPNVRAETVRLTAGVEPIKARIHQLKLSYFHKIRTCNRNRLLSKVFRARFCDFVRILPEFPSTQSPSAATLNGPIASYHNILSKYAMLHEFHPHSNITREKFKTFTKSRVHLQHFEQDINGIENSGQAALLP